MSLDESLKKMTLNGKSKKREDPVAQALRNGKTPTLKEVKMSVKVLPLSIISVTGYDAVVDTFENSDHSHAKDGAIT